MPAHLESWQARDIAIAPIAELAAALRAEAGNRAPDAFDVADGLTLAEAQAVALWHNPGLQVARAEALAVCARAQHAGLIPDPALSLSGGRKREDGADGFFEEAAGVSRSWVSAAGLSLTIPLSGRPAAQRAWRWAEYDAAALEVAVAEWTLLQELREAWIAWSAQARRAEVLDAHLKVLTAFSAKAQRLAEAGELAPGSGRLFLVDEGRTQALLDEAAHLSQARKLRLLSLAGLRPDAPVELAPALTPDSAPREQDDGAAGIAEDHPRIIRLKADYEAAEQQLQVAIRAQYPDLQLGPDFTKEKDETVIALGLGVPLPVWNRNRGGIAEAVAQRAVARARVMAAYEELTGELAQHRAAWAGASAKRTRLETEVAPLADRQIAESQALLEAGESDRSLFYAVLAQSLTIKLELVDAVAQEQIARTQLDALRTPHTLAVPINRENDDALEN
ncbi:MAG: TolC family protein [Candidatus Hydrogenedentes bacterium]|nr:TolC family protein [Candidatus Hydrogenedentota bacterium]